MPPLDQRGAEHYGVYVDGVRQADAPTYEAALAQVRELGRGFVWLSLEDPADHQMRSVARTFDIHPLAVEHTVRPRASPKVEWYDHHLVIAMRTLCPLEGEPDPARSAGGQLAVFVGKDFLVTCGRGRHTAVADVRDAAERSSVPEPSAVMHAIADRVVRDYLEVATRMREEADLAEEQVFSQSADGDIERIYFLKREIVHMRRSIEPLTFALRQFAAEHGEWISAELRHNMRDVMEQNIHAVERIAGTEALLDSLLDTAYGREGTQQNADMRKISAWAAMGAVPTTLAGIYGMRFPDMPELHWTWGYPGLLAVIVVLTGLLYRIFHRKGWL
jgi:magnesium transporter